MRVPSFGYRLYAYSHTYCYAFRMENSCFVLDVVAGSNLHSDRCHHNASFYTSADRRLIVRCSSSGALHGIRTEIPSWPTDPCGRARCSNGSASFVMSNLPCIVIYVVIYYSHMIPGFLPSQLKSMLSLLYHTPYIHICSSQTAHTVGQYTV